MFRAKISDIEPVARHSGAHVHFDLRRSKGLDSAVHVTLKRGTHVAHRQHRFGTLVGARSTDTKGLARVAGLHPELAGVAGLHPLEVARAWATSVAAGDVVGALSLYAPDVEIHLAERRLAGRRSVQSWLESVAVLGCARHARVHGVDGTVVVAWDRAGADQPGLVVRCRVAHGAIAEQWAAAPGAPEHLVAEDGGGAVNIALTTVGPVEKKDVALAHDQLLRLVARMPARVLFARLKLLWEPDPARPRRAVAQASLDVDGELIRAQVAARSMPEAVDLLANRLRDRLEHLDEHRQQLRKTTGVASAGRWRHGDLRTVRPRYFDRPVEDRQLVRHKTFAVDELTPDEAAFDMDQLDYDFYLFRDLATGIDSVIERREEGYRLSRLIPSDIDAGPSTAPMTVSTTPAPHLTLSEAMERLDAGREPFVFFAEANTGRGNVAYRRYDGHYGVITPA
jgi:ribosome-associated translation inhibitor RaiA